MPRTVHRFFNTIVFPTMMFGLLLAPASADICKMEKEAAYESEDCIRFIFECTVSKEQKFKDLPRESSQRRKYAMAANEAARECKHFSYEEAEAAFSLKLFWLGN